MFKKALYLINANKLIKGKEILKEIIDSNSKLKIFAEEIINNI